ncbi:ATP-binding protein [Pendulispora albinea]|uniref:histidine kinase n=1 Tax=Pendulispora albinea TaxID=2741071 RepID=A0ABZ2LWI1_9BACT
MGRKDLTSQADLTKALDALERDPHLRKPAAQIQRLLHDLQVHQVELEMQNRELREAHAQLEESRSRYADLFDFAPVGYCTFDRTGRIQEANLTAAGLFGTPRANVIGRQLSGLVALKDERAFRAHLQMCFTERVRVTTEVTFSVRNTNTRLTVQVVSVPLIDAGGEVMGCRTTLADITGLKYSESMLRFLADASEILASSMDAESTLGRVVHLAVPILADICFLDILVDGKAFRRVKVAWADPKRRPMLEVIKARVPDIKAGALQAQVVRSGKPYVGSAMSAAMMAHLPPQLGPIAKSILVVPLKVRERTLGVLTFIMAESGRHYSARELSVAQDVARRAAMCLERAELYAASCDAVRSRDDILAIVSHDLRDPLNGIMLAASSAQSWLEERNDTDDALNLLHMVTRSANRMTRLIAELLDWSSIQSGHLSIRKRHCSVAELFADVREMFSPTAQDKHIELVVTDAPDSSPVSCDKERVLQVLSNLISNAIKFTPRGGVIHVAAAEGEGELRLSVSDSGPGITKERLPHVFERFWQAEETAVKGRGLGLFIAKGIVEAHGGRIWAESEWGKGATFCMTLPMIGPDPRDSARASHPASGIEELAKGEGSADEATGASDGSIFLVDDDKDMRELFTNVLEKDGYSVVACENGSEALHHLHAGRRPLLILLDIQMPVMDGWTCMNELHKNASFSRIPTIVISSPEFQQQASSLGAGFLEKPLRIERLRELVDRYRAADASRA